MSDPVNEPSKPSDGEPNASLEDLMAALGRPRGEEDFPEEGEDNADADAASEDAATDDPFAEYADLDLATSLPIDPDDDLSKVSGEASPRLMSIVESLLFAADKPMTVKRIRRLLKEPTKRQIQLALKQLIGDTQHRGIVLTQVAGGFRLRTHADNAAFVQKMLAGKPVRLSRSQLESLAVVAYRQPVTKAELDHVRGVDCGAVLRVLLERDLVKIVGRKEEPGRPHLYGTTVAFLEFFNLKGLRDLPDLQEFKELSEESEATLKHSMAHSLSDEQEAMGQSRLDFEEGQANPQASTEAAAGEPETDGAEVSSDAGPLSEDMPTEDASEEAPTEETPTEETPTEEAPTEETPTEEAPTAEASEETPAEEDSEETPTKDVSEETPTEDAPQQTPSESEPTDQPDVDDDHSAAQEPEESTS